MTTTGGRSVRDLFPGRSEKTLRQYETNYRTLWRHLENDHGHKVVVPEDVIQDLTWVTKRAGDIATLLTEMELSMDPSTLNDYAQRTLIVNKLLPGEIMDPTALREIERINKTSLQNKIKNAHQGSARASVTLPTVRDIKDNFRIVDKMLDLALEHGLGPRKMCHVANAHAIYGFLAYNTDVLAVRGGELTRLAIGRRDEGNFISLKKNKLVLRRHKNAKKTGDRVIDLAPGYGDILRKSLRAYPRETLSSINFIGHLTSLVKRFFFVPGADKPNMKDIREIVMTNVHATAGLRSPAEIQQLIKDSGTSTKHFFSDYNLSGRSGYGIKATEDVHKPPREQGWVDQVAKDSFFDFFHKGT